MNPLTISILIYILFILGIYSLKPKFCFDKQGKMKQFGIGKNKTPFTFLTISIVLGIFSLILSIIYNDYMIPATEDLIKEAKEIAEEAAQVLAETA